MKWRRLKTMARRSSVFDHMTEGFAYCQMFFDARGKPIDYLYLDVNAAFDRLIGIPDVAGRLMSDVFPHRAETHHETLAAYARVVHTGVPERVETTLPEQRLKVSLSVYRPEPGHFAVIFTTAPLE